ncbi:hypothetical protein EJ110_NYTH30337 [Nymphaea thermarum]|nr:hypothetical protein EJ110_NYTH30337 [Nymphaea thermarum]
MPPPPKLNEAFWKDHTFRTSVWTAAVEALTAFTKKFISSNMTAVNKGILLQPVLVYLSAALSCISCIPARQSQNIKPIFDLFVIRTLIAYQSLPDPMLYKNDHLGMIEICTTPFRDWFEDELRAFEGGTDGAKPYLWDNELPSFPQSSLALRPQPLEPEILSLAQSIFQGILIDGDVGAAQRRAACEGLGLLSRLGNDSFTARMTRSLLNDLSGASDLSYAYAGSLAVALGCIHRSRCIEISPDLLLTLDLCPFPWRNYVHDLLKPPRQRHGIRADDVKLTT